MKTTFFGRDNELQLLRDLFELSAKREEDGAFAGPRMAFVIAESGVGKTRLVQELYLQLTQDENWDPEDASYWPNAFSDDNTRLRTVPDMSGHVPKGPPKFVWLGARWQATDVRNPQERRSALPALMSAVMTHVSIIDKYRPIWREVGRKLMRAVGQHTSDEVVERIAENIPLGGLFFKLAKGAGDLATERIFGPRDHDAVQAAEQKTTRDELMESMRVLLSGQAAVPTVLWFDDAQWIDAQAEEFLANLWTEASGRKWPLFIIVTHWEREWLEMKEEIATGLSAVGLQALAELPESDSIFLEAPSDAALIESAASHLPGLPTEQLALLTEKAGGNFLSMVENISELTAQTRWFIDGKTNGRLTSAAVDHIQRFETDRARRVAQRFNQFETEVQDVLGWSSLLGMRFLRDVIIEVASEKLQAVEARRIVERCEDPYVVFGSSSELTLEFRDRTFFEIARKFQASFLSHESGLIVEVMRKHLLIWIDGSFTDEGFELWPKFYWNTRSLERNFAALDYDERRDLLGMAAREFPLPSGTEIDWSLDENITALRIIRISISSDESAAVWQQVRSHMLSLDQIDWCGVPTNVFPLSERRRMLQSAMTLSVPGLVSRLLEDLIRRSRQSTMCDPSDAELLGLGVGLLWSGQHATMTGDHRAASSYLEEALGIFSESPDGIGSICSPPNRFRALLLLGQLEQLQGSFERALLRYEECVAIARQATDHSRSGLALEDLVRSTLVLANAKLGVGDLESVLRLADTAIATSWDLFEQLEGPESLQLLSQSFWTKAQAQKAANDPDGALISLAEAWQIASRVHLDLLSPSSTLQLFLVEQSMAEVLFMQGRGADSAGVYEDALRTFRSAGSTLEGPQTKQLEAVCLAELGDVLHTLGERDGALAVLDEALQIYRQVARGDDPTPLSLMLYAQLAFNYIQMQLDSVETQIPHHDIIELFDAVERSIDEDFNNPDPWLILNEAVNELVNFQLRAGEIDAAAEFIRNRLMRAEILADTYLVQYARHHHAICMSTAGVVAIRSDDLAGAHAHLSCSADLMQGLVDEMLETGLVMSIISNLFWAAVVTLNIDSQVECASYLEDLVSVLRRGHRSSSHNINDAILWAQQRIEELMQPLERNSVSPSVQTRFNGVDRDLSDLASRYV